MSPRNETLAHRIVRQLGGDLSNVGSNVAGLGNGTSDRSVSISQHPRDAGDVLVYCHNGADPLAFKRHLRRLGLLPSRSTYGRAAEVSQMATDRTQRAHDIWGAATPAERTPADTYLRGRGLSFPLAPWARFSPRCPAGRQTMPALIAAVVEPTTGQFRTIHRVFLRPDGSAKVDLPRHEQKRSLGPTAGAAVVLGDLSNTDRAIFEGEGIETVLSACVALSRPGIATLSAATLGRPPLPLGRPVVVLADRGAEQAAQQAAHCRVKERRRVWIATPPEGFKDWNDVLRSRGPDATRAALCQAVEVLTQLHDREANHV